MSTLSLRDPQRRRPLFVNSPGVRFINHLLSGQTQFFQTQFSTFWFFEVDQHSESKPPFPQLLLRLSPSSIETKSRLSICTSDQPGVSEIVSSRCKVDVLDCGTSVSRAAACRQSQIARLLLFPELPVHHTSEDGLRDLPLSRRGGWLGLLRQAAILPHCQLGTFTDGIQNLGLHSGLNRNPPSPCPLARQECCQRTQPHQEKSALAPACTEMGEPKRKRNKRKIRNFRRKFGNPKIRNCAMKKRKMRNFHIFDFPQKQGFPHLQGTGQTYRSSPPVRWLGPEAELRQKIRKPPQTTFTGGGGRVHTRAKLT